MEALLGLLLVPQDKWVEFGHLEVMQLPLLKQVMLVVIGLFPLEPIYNWDTIVNPFGTHSPPLATGVVLFLRALPPGALISSMVVALPVSLMYIILCASVPSDVFLIESCTL